MTVSIFLLTHENIGSALLNTARKTLGQLPLPAVAVPIPGDCEPERFIPKLKGILQNLDQGRGSGILILTDLFGSTPCNLAQALRDEIAVRIVSGINLPMLIRVMNYPHLDLNSLAEKAISGGRDGVFDCDQFCFQPYQHLLRAPLKYSP